MSEWREGGREGERDIGREKRRDYQLIFIYSAPLSQSKLKLYRGQSFTISNYTIRRAEGGGGGGGTIEIDLKVYSCISVLPGLRLSKGKKVPADRVCNELHVRSH